MNKGRDLGLILLYGQSPKRGPVQPKPCIVPKSGQQREKLGNFKDTSQISKGTPP